MVSSVVRDQSGRDAAATGAAARGAASPDGGAAIEVGCDSLLAPGSRLLLMSRELKQEQCQGRRHRLSSSHFPRKTGVHLDELRVGSVKAPIERTNTMTRRRALILAALALLCLACFGAPVRAQTRTAQQQLAVDIYKELVEINTVTATGDTARAAEAMAARLRAAGLSASDVQVFTSAPRKGNLVARLRGTGTRKPILLLAHLDVVEARREDWSVDPFKLIEKDGYFYGRGTADDKFMAAAFVANLIRYVQEGYRPDRDIILALDTDEEILDRDALGIQWLLKNHRDLIDAEFALNEGGSVRLKNGKPIRNSVQTSEKVSLSYQLEVKNRGGHSSLPTKDNAIYRLAEGLARLSKFTFPFKLNETTRAYFERTAELEGEQVAADIRSVMSGRPDLASLSLVRLSANPVYNAQLRTTCVATMLEGGHAYNALPQVARATVNCRIMPGEPVDDVKRRWFGFSPTIRLP